MPRIRTCIVGRERGCEVPLDDPSISRHHAEVVRLSGGRLYVTDRATTNGTFILDGDDWRPIRQAFLEPAGRIRFGDLEMSAGRLDALCARADARPDRAGPKGSAAPAKEDRRDSGKGLARIMREGVDSGRDTRASVWYKRSVYKRLATTEAPA